MWWDVGFSSIAESMPGYPHGKFAAFGENIPLGTKSCNFIAANAFPAYHSLSGTTFRFCELE